MAYSGLLWYTSYRDATATTTINGSLVIVQDGRLKTVMLNYTVQRHTTNGIHNASDTWIQVACSWDMVKLPLGCAGTTINGRGQHIVPSGKVTLSAGEADVRHPKKASTQCRLRGR